VKNRRGYSRRSAAETDPYPESKPAKKNAEGTRYDRPKWVAPVLSTEPLPVTDCPYCGKPVRDLAVALSDRGSNAPAHFECIASCVAENETLEKGDSITYIGGGRFGVVHFNNQRDKPPFKIVKIFEWENKENRAEWRKSVSDHYSIT
jgi:hypothetical protein